MSERRWTPEQLDAIRTGDRSLLVSAGAGAGKTAVLSERCVHLVMDASDRCNIDELLVVTFTEAAAAEMRERIGRALRQRSDTGFQPVTPGNNLPLPSASDQRRIEHQLHLLEGAQISTIHAFCRRVLVRYFSRAGLDPQAPLLDARDAALLRRDCALRVFEAWAARDDATGTAFLDLLAAYGGSRNDQIIDIALGLDNFLTSLADPGEWTHSVLDRMTPPHDGELPEFWLSEWAASLRDEIGQQLEAVDAGLTAMSGSTDIVDGLRACLDEYQGKLQDWYRRLSVSSEITALNRICNVEIPGYTFRKLPSNSAKVKKLDTAGEFERAHKHVLSIREKFFKKRLQTAFGRFTAADWAAGIARTRPHIEMLLAFRDAIRVEYDRARRDQGVLDFNDLERRTLNLLRDQTCGVAARLQRQFRHVLVDEFQDVNPIQDEILRLVSREADPVAADNLFCVGDVKQSIYRFRLAEPRIFLERAERFRAPEITDGMLPFERDSQTGGKLVDLQSNFRSAGRVLDAINGVFEHLMARDLGEIDYDEHARLKPGSEHPALAGPAMEVHVLDRAARGARPDGSHTNEENGADDQDSAPNDPTDAGALDWDQIEREAYVIAQCIHTERAAGRAFRDIAILLRSMKARTGQLIRTLARLGVPAFADTAGSLFESIEVQQQLSLLSLLDNERQDIPLAAVLRSPLLDRPLSDDDLAAIRIHADASDRATPFHQSVFDYAARGPDAALRKALEDFFAKLADWRGRIRRRPVADVLSEVFEETGCLANVSGLPDAEQRRANLLQLHEYARQFGDFRRQGLYRFLRFLEDLRRAEEDLDAGSTSAPAGDVVRIMTIHRSKGLEFPVVILGEAGRLFNMGDANGDVIFDRRLGLGLAAVDVEKRVKYPTLPHRLVRDAIRRETLAEELRVLYVALTRAQSKLIVVGTAKYSPDLMPAPQPMKGALPLISRRGAASMLDWIMAALRHAPPNSVAWPAAAEAADPLYAVHHYDAATMQTWEIDKPVAVPVQKRLEQLAAFGPLPGVFPTTAAATATALVERIAHRLGTPYRHEGLTRVPAVAAASVLKRRWSALDDDEGPSAPLPSLPGMGRGNSVLLPSHRTPSSAYRRTFKSPAFAAAAAEPDATALGTATHELLRRLDLRAPLDAADLHAQIAGLVAGGALSAGESAAVDLDSVAWFFASDLGQRLRAAAAADPLRVHRECPFVLGVAPDRYDAAAKAQDAGDVLLVRGIIDCLFTSGPDASTGPRQAQSLLVDASSRECELDGRADWEILDYKTDRVTGMALEERAADYAGQLQIYAQAVEAVWRRRPRQAWLVFLHARQIVPIAV